MSTMRDVDGESLADCSELAQSTEMETALQTLEAHFPEMDPLSKVREYLLSIPEIETQPIATGDATPPLVGSYKIESVNDISHTTTSETLNSNTNMANGGPDTSNWRKTRSMLSSDAAQYPSTISSKSELAYELHMVLTDASETSTTFTPLKNIKADDASNASNKPMEVIYMAEGITPYKNEKRTTLSKPVQKATMSTITAKEKGNNTTKTINNEIIDATGSKTPNQPTKPSNYIHCEIIREVSSTTISSKPDQDAPMPIISASERRNDMTETVNNAIIEATGTKTPKPSNYIHCEIVRDISSTSFPSTTATRRTQERESNRNTPFDTSIKWASALRIPAPGPHNPRDQCLQVTKARCAQSARYQRPSNHPDNASTVEDLNPSDISNDSEWVEPPRIITPTVYKRRNQPVQRRSARREQCLTSVNMRPGSPTDANGERHEADNRDYHALFRLQLLLALLVCIAIFIMYAVSNLMRAK